MISIKLLSDCFEMKGYSVVILSSKLLKINKKWDINGNIFFSELFIPINFKKTEEANSLEHLIQAIPANFKNFNIYNPEDKIDMEKTNKQLWFGRGELFKNLFYDILKEKKYSLENISNDAICLIDMKNKAMIKKFKQEILFSNAIDYSNMNLKYRPYNAFVLLIENYINIFLHWKFNEVWLWSQDAENNMTKKDWKKTNELLF